MAYKINQTQELNMERLKLLKAYAMAEELLKHQPISGATHKHTGSPRDDSTASYVGDDNYDEIQEA